MHLQIITPKKTIFDGEVTSVTAPGKDGSFQILENHAAVVSSLSKGSIVFKATSTDKKELSTGDLIKQNSKGEYEFPINSGILELNNNHIILLSE